jgi:hypothetical protein
MSDNVNDFLFGGGGRAAKFENIGDKVKGIITDVDVVQQTDMDTNQPLTWADGRPRMQLVVTLETGERVDDNDDGMRKVYAKGGRYEVAEGTGTSMKDAIADAVKKAGAGSLDAGATLVVAHTGLAKRTNRGFNPAKLYRAQYEAPVKTVSGADLFDD